jgi:apolipoprotein N-acyltransferase
MISSTPVSETTLEPPSIERPSTRRKPRRFSSPAPWSPSRRAAMRRFLGLGLLGLLVVLGHGGTWAYPGWWVGAWLGHASLIGIAVATQPRTALGLGLLLGWIANAWAFHWAPQALIVCADASWGFAHILTGLLLLWESVEFGLFCWMVSYAAQRGARGLFLVPVAWVAVEHGWPKIFPWLIGYSQLELLPLIQVADITGSCGIGFCLTALTALPASMYVWKVNLHRRGETAWLVRYQVAVLILLIAVLGYGYRQLGVWGAGAEGRTLRVALLQFDTAIQDSNTKLHEATMALSDSVDLVVWPESSLGTYQDDLTGFADIDRTLDRSRDSFDRLRPTEGCSTYVLAAGRTYQENAAPEGPYRMTAFLIDGNENIRGTYSKRTLLPIGEYVPGQTKFPSLRNWAALHEVIEPGTSHAAIASPAGPRLGVVICYEDLLRENARKTVQSGAEVLFSLINDSAFENPLTLEQHNRLSIMRSVENRRYFFRCAGTGVSCAIAPTGEVLKQLGPEEEGIIVQQATLHQYQTIYTRYGEVFPRLCIALCLGSLALIAYRRRSASPTASQQRLLD